MWQANFISIRTKCRLEHLCPQYVVLFKKETEVLNIRENINEFDYTKIENVSPLKTL